MKALIRLRGCAGWPGPSLSAQARRYAFALRCSHSNIRYIHSNVRYIHSNVRYIHSNVRNIHSNVRYMLSKVRQFTKFSLLDIVGIMVLIFFFITKTYLYNSDPLKPHFYIVKLGSTGVFIIFLFLLKNIDCGYSLEPPRWGGSNEYPQSMFWVEIWNISEFYLKTFSFRWWNFQYIWIGVFS